MQWRSLIPLTGARDGSADIVSHNTRRWCEAEISEAGMPLGGVAGG